MNPMTRHRWRRACLLVVVPVLPLVGMAGGAAAIRVMRADISVEGVVTVGGVETDFSGSLECRPGEAPDATGSLAEHPRRSCRRMRLVLRVLRRAARTNRLCTEIYGGPQRAAFEGRIAGRSVDVTIERSDGCGIADWSALSWLLGPPER